MKTTNLFWQVIFIIASIAFTLTFGKAWAQDHKCETKTIKMVVADNNGKVIVIDTTCSLNGDENIEKAIKKLTSSIHECSGDKLNNGAIRIFVTVTEEGDSSTNQLCIMTSKKSVIEGDSCLQHICITKKGDTKIEGDSTIKHFTIKTIDDPKIKNEINKSETITIGEGGDGEIILYCGDDADKTDNKKIKKIVYVKEGENKTADKTCRVVALKKDDQLMEISEDTRNYTIVVMAQCGDSLLKKLDEPGKADIYSHRSKEQIIIISSCTMNELEEREKSKLKDSGLKFETTPEKELDIDDLLFFPNPNNGKFSLSFSSAINSNTSINIIDSNGKVVYSEELGQFSGKYNKEIDISSFDKGAYFLQITQGEKTCTKKIIVY
ncbi:MAG: T9SS type A sorting domain-containing protein [Bacteroidetes bacterium]|nr:T9SS type A sorting domain-containing protein [Bacteroidota bacterium]